MGGVHVSTQTCTDKEKFLCRIGFHSEYTKIAIEVFICDSDTFKGFQTQTLSFTPVIFIGLIALMYEDISC